MLYFNENRVWAIYLDIEKSGAKNGDSAKVEEVLKSSDIILDAFWYSASNYIILVTEREIKAAELSSEGTRNIVILHRFGARPRGLYYDKNNDSLYFTDVQKGKWLEDP